MAFQVSGAAAPLLPPLLALLFGLSPVLVQELKETDALCNADGCFVVYFQRKIFLDSWRTCKEKGGNLATIKRREDAAAIATLFSTLDLRQSRTNIRVWIGLQRQPRQCTTMRPLRGFSWTTGDQDTEYTNWLREYTSDTCGVPRCVVMSYSTVDLDQNLKWLDGSCSIPPDGFLCHYAYKGMCPSLGRENGVDILYETPLGLVSSLLTHVPLMSWATITCHKEQQHLALCMQTENGSVGWSQEPPFCFSHIPPSPCEQDNGGCEQYCRDIGGLALCECADFYDLGEDGRTCESSDVCRTSPCQYECLQVSDGYRCACPDGHMLALDEHHCVDVNECLQSPCEQLCVNAPGTFRCECWDGYSLNDEGVCKDTDECVNKPCDHHCENTLGSYICHCDPGFSSVLEYPNKCQDIDECLIPGTCEQMCWDYEGGFSCHCKEGYKLMTDGVSCQKMGEGTQPSNTALFPEHTPHPGQEWSLTDYDYTDWPTEVDQFTDPTKVFYSQEKLAFDLTVWWEGQSSQPDTIGTGVVPTSISSTTQDQYEDYVVGETTVVPFLSTSTTSEGALYRWITQPYPSLDTVASTEPDHQTGPEVKGNRDQSQQQQEEFSTAHGSDVPTLSTVSQPPLGGSGRGDGEQDQENSTTWLLVGLLVPICIFIVVLVILGIVYCTRCGVQPQNKNTADCYHWISGAHDKQGVPNQAEGPKTCV